MRPYVHRRIWTRNSQSNEQSRSASPSLRGSSGSAFGVSLIGASPGSGKRKPPPKRSGEARGPRPSQRQHVGFWLGNRHREVQGATAVVDHEAIGGGRNRSFRVDEHSKARVTKRRRLNGRLEPPVRCRQPVKSLATLITICLAGFGGDAIANCPPGYPEGFPCISGGTFISVPSPAAQPVVPNEFYVFRYDQAARALFGSVLNEASNAAWIVQTQSEVEEPGGLRYGPCCGGRSRPSPFRSFPSPRVHISWSSRGCPSNGVCDFAG